MIYIKKDFWVPCDDIILEDSADHAVRCEKNALVVAGPGAGNLLRELYPQPGAAGRHTGGRTG